MKKILLLVIIFTASVGSTTLNAQNLFPLLGGQRVGTAAATFLKIDLGAQATAMGGAAVAMASDASVLYWNPAAAAQLKRPSLSLTHITWPADIQYEFLGYVHHLPRGGSLGLSMGMLHMADMAVTDEYHPTGTGEFFRYHDSFAALTYALKMTNRFSFGVSVKYVREDMAEIVMDGWMMDLGTFYWTGYKSLRFAVSLLNFGNDLEASGTYWQPNADGSLSREKYASFAPPTTFRVGVAMEAIERENITLTTSFQINHPVDNAENAAFGLDCALMKHLHLRAGYRVNYDEEAFTFGAGVQTQILNRDFVLDYAFKDFENLSSTHQFSLGFHF
ncbi:PorV/PorQ family protein [bacterium]|nr:PorV/PorQ family protein [bacterium]